MQQTPTAGDDFPLLCDTCLGPSKYVRMSKFPNGVECKISKRPTTLFRWSIGNGTYRQTCVDFQVASAKNICQCCMSDLTFGLPLAVRDAFLKAQKERGETMTGFADSLPQSRVGKDFQLALLASQPESMVTETRSNGLHALVEGVQHHATHAGDLGFVPRLPNLCSKWLDGGCPKGKKCELRPCCGALSFPELEDASERKKFEEEVRLVGPERFDCNAYPAMKKILKHAAKKRKAMGGGVPAPPPPSLESVAPAPKRVEMDKGEGLTSMPSSQTNNTSRPIPSRTTTTTTTTTRSGGPTGYIGFGPTIAIPPEVLRAFKTAQHGTFSNNS